MKINIAHFHLPGTTGRPVQCIVFDADAQVHTDSARRGALADLTRKAMFQYNLAVDKSALAFTEFGDLKFFGTPDLVQFLSNNGVPTWTHEIDV